MSRDEFMRQLEHLLADVTEEEKKEALEYYRGYFEDAGEENEERIIRELESPEKVARTIKADLGITTDAENGEYTERGYEDKRFTQHQDIGFQEKDTQQDNSQNAKTEDNSSKAWKIALIVIAAVITSPIWVGLAGGLFGGAMGIIGTLFGLMIAGIAVAGAFYIAGATIFGIGIACLAGGSAAVGLALIGSGFLVLSLALLATIACVWLYGKLLPWLVRGIIRLCKSLFSGRGREA